MSERARIVTVRGRERRPLAVLLAVAGLAMPLRGTGAQGQACVPEAWRLPATHLVAPQSAVWVRDELVVTGSVALENVRGDDGHLRTGDTAFAAVRARRGEPLRVIPRPPGVPFFGEPRVVLEGSGELAILFARPDRITPEGDGAGFWRLQRAAVAADSLASGIAIGRDAYEPRFGRWAASGLVPGGAYQWMAYVAQAVRTETPRVRLVREKGGRWEEEIVTIGVQLMSAVDLVVLGADPALLVVGAVLAELPPLTSVGFRPYLVRRAGDTWGRPLPLAPWGELVSNPVLSRASGGVLAAWISDGPSGPALLWRVAYDDGSLGDTQIRDGFVQVERGGPDFPGLVLGVRADGTATLLRLTAEGADELGTLQLIQRVAIAIAGPPGRPHVIVFEQDPSETEPNGQLVAYDFGCAWRKLRAVQGGGSR